MDYKNTRKHAQHAAITGVFSIRRSFTHRDQEILYTSGVLRMSWGDRCVRDRRVEFVIRASRGESMSALCWEYEIARPTGYLWLRRFQQEGVAGIEERSHRPHHSPGRTAAVLEQRIAQLRAERPDWGAQRFLQTHQGRPGGRP